MTAPNITRQSAPARRPARASMAPAVHTHMTNSRLTDPEVLELRYPVLLEDFHVRRLGAAPAQRNAGDGTIRAIRFLEQMECAILSGFRRVRPFGLFGGTPERPARISSGAGGQIEGSNATVQHRRDDHPGPGAMGEHLVRSSPRRRGLIVAPHCSRAHWIPACAGGSWTATRSSAAAAASAGAEQPDRSGELRERAAADASANASTVWRTNRKSCLSAMRCASELDAGREVVERLRHRPARQVMKSCSRASAGRYACRGRC